VLRYWISPRALEDVRQTELIQQALADSDKVYGYRKPTDDLRDAGEACSEIVGIATAQIGYKRRLGRYGGKPTVFADNTLDKQLDFNTPDTV
jgi:putative transposase